MPLPLDELVAQPSLVNLRAQESDWDELLFEYELALDDTQAWLRGLSEEQVHFKPAETIYSIAEIVTHNAASDELLWSWIALLMVGRAAQIDPQALISGAGAQDTATRLELDARNEACRALARHTIDLRPPAPDLTAMTPHPYFGALNAKGWIYFMALHRGLHRYQCESVIDSPGFPRSVSVQTQPREAYQPSDRKTWLKQDARRKQPGAAGKKQSAQGTAARKRPTGKKKTAARSP